MLVWLRGLIVALLLLAAWNPGLPLQPLKTVVLLDQSPSDLEAVWVISPRLELPAQYIAFASAAQEVASASSRRLDLGEGTNLAAALQKAQSLHPDQIVLVSDGLFQTQGVAPVPLYGLYQPPSPNVSLSLSTPALPSRGDSIEVRAVIESTATAQARLTFEGPAGSQSRELQIKPGQTSIGYRFRLEKPEKVRATLKTDQQQSVEKEITPVDSTRVLVLGDPAVAGYLKAQGFAVTQASQVSLPISAEVVVLGVGVGQLSGGEVDALQSFLNQGGSLLWTATPKGLFFGGWDRSALADAIPLEPQQEPGGVALVLVLDVSGSMGDEQKLELATEGATALVDSARPQDSIGVVLFSSQARWLFRPRPMTEQGRKEAESLLSSARAGGGTVLGDAYTQAVEALAVLPNKNKQVLVLTDGLAQDAGDAILKAAQTVAPKIKTNTVALGSDADQNFLRNLARQGQGSFWNVPSPQDLPRFFLEQAEQNFKRRSLEGSFPVTPTLHPIAQNLEPPPLFTLMPAKAKPWAQTPLVAAQGAVLAVGESGQGRVAALATDLSRSWKNWKQTGALLAEITRWLSKTPARPTLEASRSSTGVRVVLGGQFSQPRIRFGGQEMGFAPVGSLRYQADLPVDAQGLAQVLEGDQTRLSLELPQLAEWRLENGQENLKRLSEASGGRLMQNAEEAKKLTGRKKTPLGPWLLGLALGLFLLERFLEGRKMFRPVLN